MKFLIKLDRFFAWTLLFGIITYYLTGYGMTKNLINSGFATNLHSNLLPIIILIAFTFHGAYATRIALVRWGTWNLFFKILWLTFFCLILFGFLYMDLYYQKTAANLPVNKTTATPSSTISPTETTSKNNQDSSSVKYFTLTELSSFNGLNGQPAYVAVDGIVYDLSSVFEDGSHFQHLAGQELTDEFYTKHVESEITKYPTVGEIKQ